MTRLLYIEAPPRKARSHSIAVAEAFLDVLHATSSDVEVDRLDLWAEPLPEFDGGAIDAKHAYRLTGDVLATDEDHQIWERVSAVFERFADADAYLISSPMWNFGVPYKLKHYFDVMAQPGLAFSFSEDGVPTGHVTGKPAVIIAARGGAYGDDSPLAPMDHQVPWLETMLRFIGFEDISRVLIEPTIGAPATVSQTRADAIAEAEVVAHRLARINNIAA